MNKEPRKWQGRGLNEQILEAAHLQTQSGSKDRSSGMHDSKSMMPTSNCRVNQKCGSIELPTAECANSIWCCVDESSLSRWCGFL